MVNAEMKETLDVVLEAVRQSGVRAILSTGWGGVEIPRRDDIFVAEYVPHDWLFKHVSGVVHHGGAGTTATGILLGCPTLIIPFGGDQPFWGLQVHAMGCGPKPVKRDSMTVGKLTRALIDLTTNDNYRIKAEEVGARMRQEHGVEEAANLIEQSIAAWRCEKEA